MSHSKQTQNCKNNFFFRCFFVFVNFLVLEAKFKTCFVFLNGTNEKNCWRKSGNFFSLKFFVGNKTESTTNSCTEKLLRQRAAANTLRATEHQKNIWCAFSCDLRAYAKAVTHSPTHLHTLSLSLTHAHTHSHAHTRAAFNSWAHSSPSLFLPFSSNFLYSHNLHPYISSHSLPLQKS